MSTARKKYQITNEGICIYCGEASTTIDHMPPKVMFDGKNRPPGLEFASCHRCNHDTGMAETAAAFMARLPQSKGPLSPELLKLRNAVVNNAPEFLLEVLGNHKKFIGPTPAGLLTPLIAVFPDGPMLSSYMDVFGAKFGMAMFREYTGQRLPNDGLVYSTWLLPSAMSSTTMRALLEMMPCGSSISQGRKRVDGQFTYRYNSDNKTVVAALAKFHAGLYIFTIATSRPDIFDIEFPFKHSAMTRPGELVARMPKRYGFAVPSQLILPSSFNRKRSFDLAGKQNVH